MGRGSSKAGSGNNSVSGKPFNPTDWKTWTKGTQVQYNGSDDVGIVDGEVRRNKREIWDDGVVKEVHSDHLIVSSDGTNLWLDADTADLFRIKRK